MPADLTRRGFVAAAGAVAASGAEPPPALAFFTAPQAEVVEAIVEQIIPGDHDPGAKQAGVVYFIDKQLGAALKRFAPFYRAGLEAFAASCKRETGANFPDLAFAAQTRFLERLEKGEITGSEWTAQNPAAFFSMLIDHTMQGFYGSPQHGGNRDGASWKMLGIEKVMGLHSTEHAK